MAELAELHLIVVWFCNCVAQICPKYVQPNIVDLGYSVAGSKTHLGSLVAHGPASLPWSGLVMVFNILQRLPLKFQERYAWHNFSRPYHRWPLKFVLSCTERFGSISLCAVQMIFSKHK